MNPTSDLDQLAKDVKNDLLLGRDRDDILLEVCQRAGMDWNQVEEFIQEVEYLHGGTIQGSKSLFLIAASWLTMLGGLGLMGGMGYLVLTSRLDLAGGLYAFGFGLLLFVGGVIGMFNT